MATPRERDVGRASADLVDVAPNEAGSAGETVQVRPNLPRGRPVRVASGLCQLHGDQDLGRAIDQFELGDPPNG